MALTKSQLKQLRDTAAGRSGNRIQTALDLIGESQVGLARALGMPQTYVADTVRGRWQSTTVDNARKFATFFGCTIEDLFPPRVGRSSHEAVA